ncbi:hypothetical protein RB195_006751 [Necator americanus]|uniref:Uncharacterized protein n=1 Tax=Necator americanus TaxID=51031 RepID=A0ABR1BXD7_NECAM
MFHGQRISRRLGYTKDITLSAFPAGIQVRKTNFVWTMILRRPVSSEPSANFDFVNVEYLSGKCVNIVIPLIWWSIRIRDGRLWRGGDSVHFFLIAVKKGPGRCGAAQGWRAPVELLVENSAPERLKPCIDG